MSDLEIKTTINGELIQSEEMSREIIKAAVQEGLKRLGAEIVENVRRNANWMDMAVELKKEVKEFHLKAFFMAVSDYTSISNENERLRLEIMKLKDKDAYDRIINQMYKG